MFNLDLGPVPRPAAGATTAVEVFMIIGGLPVEPLTCCWAGAAKDELGLTYFVRYGAAYWC